MIACDNFCYFVALAWRLLANGLLIFNLPHTFLKICFCSFPYFTSTFHYSHQLQATEYTSASGCVCWPRSHLCDWQSLIFALKLKKFHHFSICCCRTCKRNSRSPPSNSLSNSLIKHTDFLSTPAPLSHRHPFAVSLERGEGPSCNCISLVRRFLRVTCHTTITATVTVASTTFAYATKTMLRNATKTTANLPNPLNQSKANQYEAAALHSAHTTHSLGMGENHSVYDDMICHGEPINYHSK